MPGTFKVPGILTTSCLFAAGRKYFPKTDQSREGGTETASFFCVIKLSKRSETLGELKLRNDSSPNARRSDS
jgi:hypothetical protein